MTKRAGRRKPGVNRAWPVGQPPIRAHAAASSGPAARWIAPHTPPPGASASLAAFTIASTAYVVMSPRSTRSVGVDSAMGLLRCAELTQQAEEQFHRGD